MFRVLVILLVHIYILAVLLVLVIYFFFFLMLFLLSLVLFDIVSFFNLLFFLFLLILFFHLYVDHHLAVYIEFCTSQTHTQIQGPTMMTTCLRKCIAVKHVCMVHVNEYINDNPICKTPHSNSHENVTEKYKNKLCRTLKMKDTVNTPSSNIKATVAIKHQRND